MGTKRITLLSFTGAPNKRVFYETLNGVRGPFEDLCDSQIL